MTIRMRFAFFSFIFLAFFLFACGGGTKLTSVNGPKSFAGEPFQKMMILAVAKTPENQKLFEDAFAAAVDASGTRAIAASAVLPAGTDVTKEIVVDTARKEGVDCVLVTHLIRVGQRKVDVPVAPAGSQSPINDGSFYNYYPVAYSYVHYPDLEKEQAYVRLKTIFYAVENQKKLWSASSESVEPKSVQQMVKQLAPKIIASLEEYRLIN